MTVKEPDTARTLVSSLTSLYSLLILFWIQWPLVDRLWNFSLVT